MPLRYVPLDQQGPDIALTQTLFESAFPVEERPPFELVLKWDHHGFNGVYQGEDFVGLVYFVEHKDLVYVFFLAIEEPYRNQGIGSRILSDVKARFAGKRVFLLAEEVGERYPDNALRMRRIGFYRRNGFLDSGLVITEYNVRYHVLTLGGVKVGFDEYYALMEALMGEARTKQALEFQ